MECSESSCNPLIVLLQIPVNANVLYWCISVLSRVSAYLSTFLIGICFVRINVFYKYIKPVTGYSHDDVTVTLAMNAYH